jgi:CheY-like chemotaxis protein
MLAEGTGGHAAPNFPYPAEKPLRNRGKESENRNLFAAGADHISHRAVWTLPSILAKPVREDHDHSGMAITGTRRTIHQNTLYLVEDDPAVALSLSALLRASGLDVHHFSSADLFLEAVAALKPGCVLSDIHMAGTNGIQGIQELRARDIDWPVIVMTGSLDEDAEALARACGAVEFLHKPFGREEMVRAIRRVQPLLPAA